jgi:membrane-associated protease RseP (regulator of RpoE activity)
LHVSLVAITLITTSVMGAAFVRGFRMNQPVDVLGGLDGYRAMFADPSLLISGLPFSLALMSILLAHELGHYFACLYYDIDASAPYFIPFPAPIGTLGAFIRIRAPIYSKRVLFDIAVAGPLAGFALLLPVMAVGIAWSKVIPGIANEGDLVFGVPLIVRLIEAAVFPGVPAADIYLHPIARAAWVGVLATALNLLPIGQLDGGHIVYSFAGDRSRILSRVLVAALIPIGLLYSYSWLIWAAFLFFFGMRHPVIYDPEPLGGGRRWLGWLAMAIFVLSFTVEPVRR